MPGLITLPLDAKWFANVHETALGSGHAVVENCYVNEAGGISALPRLRLFVQLDAPGRVYLAPFMKRHALVAVTSHGRTWEIGEGGTVKEVTRFLVPGNGRAIFAETDDELIIARGGALTRFAGTETELFSDEAPDSTHVGYLDGYVVTFAPDTGLFYYSLPGQFRTFDPLDVASAESKPDPIIAMHVTEFNEVMFCGAQSIEVYRTAPSGTVPFYRLDSVGHGLYAPYCLAEADRAMWVVNRDRELVRLHRDGGAPVSGDIGRLLDGITDWTDAWLQELQVAGQRFVVLQIPEAKAPLGYTGLTLLYDYRNGRWYTLASAGPSKWPGWSIATFEGRILVGADDGQILEFVQPGDWHDASGVLSGQRMLVRTAPYEASRLLRAAREIEISDLWITARREYGDDTTARLRVRVNLDGMGWSRVIERPLMGTREPRARFGAFGTCSRFQVEIEVLGDYPVEIVSLQAEAAAA